MIFLTGRGPISLRSELGTGRAVGKAWIWLETPVESLGRHLYDLALGAGANPKYFQLLRLGDRWAIRIWETEAAEVVARLILGQAKDTDDPLLGREGFSSILLREIDEWTQSEFTSWEDSAGSGQMELF